jgi:predicted dinucleotide-utilizing enzyme
VRPRKQALLGDKPKDIRAATERLQEAVSKRDTVVEYTVASGANVVRHGQPALPSGRHIVWNEAGAIVDTELTATKWEFTAAAAGKIKVIWL